MKQHGFTLLELLVTMAIVAVLTSIAWPGYAAVMHRAQRNDARLALLRIQYAEELRYQDSHAYTDHLADSAALGGLGLAEHSAAAGYALAVSISEDGQHYTATATTLPDGRQAGDHACHRLSIDETGRQRSADADGNWSDDPRRCWQ